MKDQAPIRCDTQKCVECHSCEAACKAFNQVEPGVKYRWVTHYWEGEYPNVVHYSESIGCYHCENAPCVDACPSNAIRQDPVTLVVTVDPETCDGHRSCFDACPYEIPQFGQDGKMRKCDLCFDKAREGEVPICVETCPSGALSLTS